MKYPTSQTTASSQSRREHVRRVILKSPELTNRNVAERTGAAQSTVSEVRRELRAGLLRADQLLQQEKGMRHE